MKIYFLPLIFLLMFASCKNDDGLSFKLNEPITAWNLSKNEVKSLENRTLQNESDYELIYKGSDPETLIYYEFDEIPGEVWLAESNVNYIHNRDVFDNIFGALKKLYGINYDENKYGNDEYYSWDSGDTHVELHYGADSQNLKYYRVLQQ